MDARHHPVFANMDKTMLPVPLPKAASCASRLDDMRDSKGKPAKVNLVPPRVRVALWAGPGESLQGLALRVCCMVRTKLETDISCH